MTLVWQLWTEPEHFKTWYGPAGATIPTATMDVRVGGIRHLCMDVQTPNGPMQMWFAGEYLEVIEHRRLVYTESMSDEHGATPAVGGGEHVATEVRVEFENLGSRTRIVLVHAGIPQDSPGATGWEMALDKLATRLTRTNQL
ncbi:MAG: SRPBCC domain-containing protein [Microbacteriaceae bacterium]